jgi:hypothetical protein
VPADVLGKVAYIYSREATAAAGIITRACCRGIDGLQGRSRSPFIDAVAYVHEDLLPVNKGKAERTHALATAYGLLQPSLVRLIAPKEATLQQLTEFHDGDYLERLADSKPQPKPKQKNEKRNLFGMKMDNGTVLSQPSLFRQLPPNPI